MAFANWTGLVTEMDRKSAEKAKMKGAGFLYTRANWVSRRNPADLEEKKEWTWARNIDFVMEGWRRHLGSGWDTRYWVIYQSLMYTNKTTSLSPEPNFQKGCFKHIYSDWITRLSFWKKMGVCKRKIYLWVSNQTAHDLMVKGNTSASHKRSRTTRIWEWWCTADHWDLGFFALHDQKLHIEMAELPIQTTAR